MSEHSEPRGWWDGRLFIVLLAGAAVGAAAVVPYSLALTGTDVAELGVSLPVLILLSVAQTLVLGGIAILLGMRLGYPIGLGAPVVRRILRGGSWPWPNAGRRLGLWAGAGVAAAAVIVVLDPLLFAPVLQGFEASGANPSAWQGLLASFYGGIFEELLLRFGLMSTLAWILTRLSRAQVVGAWQFWTANIVAAILFGAGHLPATAAVVPLTTLVVTRALLLNGIPGVIFGWLYGRDGLLAAIVAHFSADIILHVALPLLAG